jgi:hypothetical protein
MNFFYADVSYVDYGTFKFAIAAWHCRSGGNSGPIQSHHV